MEEINKKLFEMQGPGFSKDPGDELPFGIYRLGEIFQLLQPAALDVSH